MVTIVAIAMLSSAFGMDHSAWQSVLDKYRTASAKVDYAGIQGADALGPYVEALQTAAEPTQEPAKLAFWLNAYNALTIDVVADSWPISSVKQIDNGELWTARMFTVAGQRLTLDQIEKEKLMPLGDPRVHFALNCASLGCPPLQSDAFLAESVDRQLTDATKTWLPAKGVLVDSEANKVTLSSIFDWYAADFLDPGGSAIPGLETRLQGVAKFAAKNTPESTAMFLLKGGYTVGFYPFGWNVNAK
jgi:hypothetical protein